MKTITKTEFDFLGGMNMCDELSNEAYEKIVNHFKQPDEVMDELKKQLWKETDYGNEMINYYAVLDILARYFGVEDEY